MPVSKRLISALAWLLNLFNPPPLEFMTQTQKVSRVFLITSTVVVSCILVAMIGTMILFIVECGRKMLSDTPHFITGLCLIVMGVGVNVACVFVLFHIRKTDRKLME